jgi:hypothetical protein
VIIIRELGIFRLAGCAKVCAECDDKRLLVMWACGQAVATLQGRYGFPICQSVPVCSDVSVLLSRFLRTSAHAETKCFHFGVVCHVFYVSVGAGFARMS